MLSRSKNPRFRVSFNIIEVTNLPQLSGSCYVKWSVKELSIINRLNNNYHHGSDGTDLAASSSMGSEPVKPLSSTPVTRSMRTDSGSSLHILSRKNDKTPLNYHNKSSVSSMESNSSSRNSSELESSIFGKHHKGVTELYKIENHKVMFNFLQESEVKFDYSRLPTSEVNLHDKFLILQIYLDNHDYLGEIRINLLDYVVKSYKRKANIHGNGKTLDKYLLQHSKINSIISLVIDVELIKGDYSTLINVDRLTKFIPPEDGKHTMPSLSNSSTNNNKINITRTISNSSNNPNATRSSSNNSVNDELTSSTSNSRLPHLRIGSQNGNGSPRSSHVKTSPPSSPLSKVAHNLSSPLNLHNHHLNFSPISNNTNGLMRKLEDPSGASMRNMQNSMMMTANDGNGQDSDIIDALYYETLKVEWDPRPGEFNPKECINDIFRGGNGWRRTIDGVNYVDSTEGYYYGGSSGNKSTRGDSGAKGRIEANERGNYYNNAMNGNGISRVRRGNTTFFGNNIGSRKIGSGYSQEGMFNDETPVGNLRKAETFSK